MENVTSFLSNLISNPFATPVGQLIERATDVSQASEDWGLYMEICDVINESEDGPKDAARAIKKQISNNIGKSNTIVMYTLTILETCVKNCGKNFHLQIAQKDFIQELIRLAMPKSNPPQFVLDKVLGLIQTWADAFRGDPDLQEFSTTYEELREKGCEFPMTDLDGIAPIHTPARSVPEPERQRELPATVAPIQAEPNDGDEYVYSAPLTLGAQDLAKLRSELDIVVQNCRVFGEMMTENTPGQIELDDLHLIRDLERACRQMQLRIVDLIARVQNENVTEELLQVNDQINNVILRYERFDRLNAAQCGPTEDTPSANSQLQNHARPENVQTANLVDIDDVLIDTLESTDSSNVRLAEGKPEDQAFDMFAQSRQSFEENLPRTNRNAYQNQEEDQTSRGLGAAVTLKSRGLAYKTDTEADEMEQWLKSSNEAGAEVKESATSSEFDSFLATRAKEAGTEESALANSSRGGRALQTSEEEQALFSL